MGRSHLGVGVVVPGTCLGLQVTHRGENVITSLSSPGHPRSEPEDSLFSGSVVSDSLGLRGL